MFEEKLASPELNKFNKGELVVRTAGAEGHRIYAAFQPKKFMLELLVNFEIVKYIAGGNEENIIGMQDTWLLRKPIS
jgi:hypothetical protein